MKIVSTSLAGCKIIEPRVFPDARGYFLEVFNESNPFSDDGFRVAQVNTSRSARGVLRGLHFQVNQPQAKYVWVLEGEVFDVAIDINPQSKTFGQWEAVILSAQNHRQFYIPEGYAHGFQVLSEHATFCYMCSRNYRAEFDRGIAFDDPDLAIEWPLPDTALVSDKDRRAPRLSTFLRD